MRKIILLLLMSLLLTISFQSIIPSLCSAQCPNKIDPSFKAFKPGGTFGVEETIKVTALSGCSWTATSNDTSWITIESIDIDKSEVNYSVKNNTDDNHRTGTITIGDKTFTVFQGSELNVGYISGRVHDAVNNRGLKGATINIFSKGRSTTSITDGGYFIQITETDETFNPPYTINVTRTGYLDKEISGVVVEFLELTFLDIDMSPIPITPTAERPSSISVPSSDSDGNYSVSWGASSTSGVSYVLQEATNSGFTSGLRDRNLGSSTSANITGRSNGVTYYYRVRATKSGYNSSAWRTGSNGCTVTTKPTLTGLTINGPSSINESSTASYTATANWSNGTTSIVTPAWSENSSHASINSSGKLTTSSVTSNKTVTVSAGYTHGGVTRTASKPVTIVSGPKSCPESISPLSKSFGPGGGTDNVNVVAPDDCNWSASSSEPSWLEITSGNSETGNGTVNYTVSENTSTSKRTGTITIEDQIFTVIQEVPVLVPDISISHTSHDFGSMIVGSVFSPPHTFTVTNMGDTGLIAGTLWITGTDSSEFSIQNDNCSAQTIAVSGTCTVDVVFYPAFDGIKSANLSIPSNDPDTPTLDVPLSGVGGTCTYSISHADKSFNSDGGMDSVSVTAEDGCDWTAISNAFWINIDSGNSGSGNGTVSYSVSANTGSSRTGGITIAGKPFTVTQDGGIIGTTPCPESISPVRKPFGPGGGTDNVMNVVAPDGCDWTASSSDPSWLKITSGGSGTGDGTVNYSVLHNTSGSERDGTVTIVGDSSKVLMVTQSGAGADPVLNILARASDESSITSGISDTLSVSVSLAAGGSSGMDSDWWVVAETQFGWYYFDVFTMNWVYAGDFYTDLSPSYQGQLFDLSTFEVLNMSGLPAGTYTFYFAVDTNMDGILDLGELFFDSVVVNITP